MKSTRRIGFLAIISSVILWAVIPASLPSQEPQPSSNTQPESPSDQPTVEVSDSESEAQITTPDSNSALIANITIFVLAVFVGFEVITKVPATLHTPLMSGSNAISGISLVGALLAAGVGQTSFAGLLGFLAVILATINAVGGFLVTDRMLGMFRRN